MSRFKFRLNRCNGMARSADREAQVMKIRTTFVYPPIPIRQFDWSAVEDDYEPGCPHGTGATEQEAIADLMAQIEERSDDRTNGEAHEPSA